MKLISTIEKKIPEGFGYRWEAGKICIFNKDWDEEICRLAGTDITKGSDDFAGIEYLHGRGCPAVVPFTRGKLVIRHYYHGGVIRGLTGDIFWGTSRFLNELGLLAAAHRFGLPVPAPAGMIIEPAGGGLFRADLVSLHIPDSFELLSYYRQLSRHPSREEEKEKRLIISRAGRAVAALHGAGFRHADLQLKNIVIRKTPDGPRIFILDFDKARREKFSLEGPVRANLLRLYRSFCKMRISNPHISAFDPIRFIRSYAPNDKELRKSLMIGVLRRRWRARFRLFKWRITLRLRGSSYAQTMP